MTQAVAATTKTVLIVDDEAPVVKALTLRCEQLGVAVKKAGSAADALEVLRNSRARPDLLLLDFNLAGSDGLTLCEMLKADLTLSPIPVILLTGYDDEQTRARAQRAGAHFVKKDVNSWQVLQPLIERLLNLGTVAGRDLDQSAAARHEGNGRILLIDDDPALAKTLCVRLQSAGFEVYAAYTGMQGYWMALKEEPDLIVLDYKMPEGWGNTILGKLKSNPLTRDVPVIILSGMTDLGVQRDIVRLGAECWVNKPFDVKAFVKLVQNTLSEARS